MTRWTIIAILFNIINIKVNWLIVKLKLLDCPICHEPVEIRCAEVASCVHGSGGELLEIGGIAKDKLIFLSVVRTKKHSSCVMAQYHSSIYCDWYPNFHFYFWSRCDQHFMWLARCQTKYLMYSCWLGIHIQLLSICQHRMHQKKRLKRGPVAKSSGMLFVFYTGCLCNT